MQEWTIYLGQENLLTTSGILSYTWKLVKIDRQFQRILVLNDNNNEEQKFLAFKIKVIYLAEQMKHEHFDRKNLDNVKNW